MDYKVLPLLKRCSYLMEMRTFCASEHAMPVTSPHGASSTLTGNYTVPLTTLKDTNLICVSYLNWNFFRQPVLAGQPRCVLPDPSADAAWYGEIWTRYPLSPTLSQTNFGHYFTAISRFRVILSELCHASFGKNSKLPAQQAITSVRRLLEWFQKLPTALKPKYVVLPAHFLMQ
jgi:hypothetical protein